jgi:hypothetical protein
MSDNLRNNVVFPTTSLQSAWETNDVRKCHVENTGIERTKVFVQMFARSCGQWTESLTKRANKNVVAKGTTDDNVDTHRKMRHTQRQGSRTIDLIRRVYGRICRDEKFGGGCSEYATHASSREAEDRRPAWLS